MGANFGQGPLPLAAPGGQNQYGYAHLMPSKGFPQVGLQEYGFPGYIHVPILALDFSIIWIQP